MTSENAFFKELFESNHYFNQQLITIIQSNAEVLSGKCTSLMSHILNAHQIWNFRIENKSGACKPWDVHLPEQLQAIDNANFIDSIAAIEKFSLDADVQYQMTNGQAYMNTVRVLLFQIINHSTYHKGQIATAFREAGIEPLLTDYIYYKMINTQ